MKSIFKECLLNICPTLSVGQIETFWQNLYQHYHEKQRYYHTFAHIQAMLQHFNQIKHNLNNPSAVLLAIFYHDVIYQPNQTDNEQQSVYFLRQTFQSYLPTQFIEISSHLILLTKNHLLINNNEDDKYFLDMDLAILGSPHDIYQQYSKNIRQEYQHISDNLYQKERILVLQNFLQRERLFFTEFFYQRLEKQARNNLLWEIFHLKHQNNFVTITNKH